MRHQIKLLCLALLLAAPALADIAPPPDQGPPSASVAGLDFAMQTGRARMPPGYYKTFPIIVLVGCTEGTANCTLAHSNNVIGMEVDTVDGDYLRPEVGRITQIVNTFKSKPGAKTVALKFSPKGSGGQTVTVSFAKQ